MIHFEDPALPAIQDHGTWRKRRLRRSHILVGLQGSLSTSVLLCLLSMKLDCINLGETILPSQLCLCQGCKLPLWLDLQNFLLSQTFWQLLRTLYSLCCWHRVQAHVYKFEASCLGCCFQLIRNPGLKLSLISEIIKSTSRCQT